MAQLLLLSALFFLQRHTDDLLHGAGEEDGVCWGEDLRKNTVILEHGGCFEHRLARIGRMRNREANALRSTESNLS